MRVVNGWVDVARPCPSPNFNQRPEACAVDLLVVHSISLPPGEYGAGFIEPFFCNSLDIAAHPYFAEIAELQVSAHFLIYRTGELVQCVSCDDRAWHAGASEYCGRTNCNDFSLGVELEGSDEDQFSSQQYQRLIELTLCLASQFPDLTLDRITGHEDIAPGRKTDPGPGFDWGYFRDQLRLAGMPLGGAPV